ncbi:hypothetical protein LWC34_53155 [Kibdelosporangium philippinense]|uniref:Uncharacterized protein n=1 Tax=Kibdelosporangium philippinense TaxID=211113 RepID=A0ABS8ZY29_9PSEU|nr:hypothetical protein [Kibdelosporangium philippinense]MCE7011508.1 hypothetical protein [Kibdelosporangium philippinense]
MTFFVVVQPTKDDLAQVHEPIPGVRQLIAGNDQAGFTIQVPARVGGLADAAHFARALANAAADFAAWCEEQNRTRSYVPDSGEGWAAVRSLRPDSQS